MNDEKELKIEIYLPLKDMLGIEKISDYILSLISEINRSDKKSSCRIYSRIDSKKGKEELVLSINYVDYPNIFMEKNRSNELKIKDFTIITLSMMTNIIHSYNHIINELESIALKLKKANVEVSGDNKE